MTTENSATKRRKAPSRRPKAKGVSRLQVGVLVLTLGVYMGLFGLLPRLDAWRKGNTQNESKSPAESGQKARVWVAPNAFPLTPPTPAQLRVPDLPPLAVTPEPLAKVTLPPLTGTSGSAGATNARTGQASAVAPQVQPLPTLPPVQIQPLPTLAPLPQVAAPVVRSRGS